MLRVLLTLQTGPKCRPLSPRTHTMPVSESISSLKSDPGTRRLSSPGRSVSDHPPQDLQSLFTKSSYYQPFAVASIGSQKVSRFRSHAPPLPLGDPALIHPFLAEIGKDRRKSTEDDLDTGAAALHLAVRCGSGASLSLTNPCAAPVTTRTSSWHGCPAALPSSHLAERGPSPGVWHDALASCGRPRPRRYRQFVAGTRLDRRHQTR